MADALTANGIAFEFETLKVPYVRKTFYKPDFILLSNGIIVETKGYFESDDRSKHLKVKEEHPDLDVRFVFSNAHKLIGAKSTTTYAAWCSHHGFAWAERLIPREWLLEAPNAASLAAIAHLREKSTTRRKSK